MHPRVLPEAAWNLVRSLATTEVTKGWTLAGGTALALQFGHRVSIDLDFFRPEEFSTAELLRSLGAIGRVSVRSQAGGTLHATLDGMRLSFLLAEAPFLHAPVHYRKLDIARPEDIAVMKLLAIAGRGSRKDFIDLHLCLHRVAPLPTLLSSLRRRFQGHGIEYDEFHILKSLVFFDDAEAEPMPRMLHQSDWSEVKNDIVAAVRELSP